MNKSNSENKDEVLNLKKQYSNMYNTILSKIQEYSINLKNIYEEKIKELNNKEKMNLNAKYSENNRKIEELSEIIDNLKSENNNLLNDQKNNLANIAKITKEKEVLQKENKNLNNLIIKLKEEKNLDISEAEAEAQKENKIIELQNEKDELINNIENKRMKLKT
jgi:hypothetical protein